MEVLKLESQCVSYIRHRMGHFRELGKKKPTKDNNCKANIHASFLDFAGITLE